MFFLPYQIKWIKSRDKYRVWVKSRQIGATFAEAYWAFITRLQKKEDLIFCSANFKTSKEFITYVKQFAQATNIALNQDVIGKEAFLTECVIFPNGSRIIVVSSNPTALRGFHGSVILDEFAFHENAEELYKAAQPVVTWGGDLHIISTHDGSGTVFNQILSNPKNFKVFLTTLVDAVNDGLAEKIPGPHKLILNEQERRQAYIQAVKDSCLNEEMFKQEYMAETLSASSIISPELYDKVTLNNFAVARDSYNINLDTCGPLFVGIDIGRTKDSTQIYVIEQGEDTNQKNPRLRTTFRTILVKSLRNVAFDAQFEAICGIINNRKVKRVLVENNGIGMQLSEQLERTFPNKVHGWTTTEVNKQIAIERFAGWVAQDRIALPKDQDVKEDILAMKRVIVGNKLKYEGHTKTSHCDIFIAASLALEGAVGEPIVDFKHEAVSSPYRKRLD